MFKKLIKKIQCDIMPVENNSNFAKSFFVLFFKFPHEALLLICVNFSKNHLKIGVLAGSVLFLNSMPAKNNLNPAKTPIFPPFMPNSPLPVHPRTKSPSTEIIENSVVLVAARPRLRLFLAGIK